MANVSTQRIEVQVIAVTKNFLSEMGAERARLAVTLNASLDRDLGIGSLEKAELLHRFEKYFSIQLSETLFANAETLQDFVVAIQSAKIPETNTHEAIVPHLEKTTTDVTTAKTLVDVLTAYAQIEPQRSHIYLQDEKGHETIIRYGELFNNAKKVAQGLIAEGLKQGETVAIMLPTSADFFYAFFGILLVGAIPVPIYPPFRPNQLEEYAKREAIILRNAEVRILITFAQAETLSKILKPFIPSLHAVKTATELQQNNTPLPEIIISSNDLALIQYTSGSTGNPKGVALSNANLLANIRAYGLGIEVKPTDVVVSWLPLYHDMGLIGAWLGSLYYGAPVIIMSPLTFLTRPERWLWTIHTHRGTISAGPNFAYELCLRKIEDSELEGLDLSSWRIALNGAEAVYPRTVENFIARFSQYGFKANASFPAYGLAESSVALVFPPAGREPRIDRIARDPFELERKAIPFAADQKNTLEFVSCGKALPGHEVRIVDENGNELPERQVGDLEFRGPSSMQGYYRNPEATQAVFHDGWWNSGDLAYIAEGDIFITGRKKDMIIKAGRNIYPPEVEEIVNEIAGIRRGCAVAFGALDANQGTEKFIIVAESLAKNSVTKQKIITNIVEQVSSVLGLPPDEVILVKPRTIPKTSSGKLRRSSALAMYQQNKLQRPGLPVWLQFSKLFVSGQSRQARTRVEKLTKFIYTGYVWGLLGITLPLLWIAVHIISRKNITRLIKYWARTILKFAAIPTFISGEENLQYGPVIYAPNHSSYMDAIVLMSFLPPGTLFLGKKELFDAFFLGTFMKRLGHLSVNRIDFAQSLADAQKIVDALKQNKSIVIFPEGTFTYATGLRPFKLGAFKVAVESHVPICPIALRGTRKILRSGSNLFRPNVVHVYIAKPVQPHNKEWKEVIRLRDETYHFIAAHCGEPALELIRAGHDL